MTIIMYIVIGFFCLFIIVQLFMLIKYKAKPKYNFQEEQVYTKEFIQNLENVRNALKNIVEYGKQNRRIS